MIAGALQMKREYNLIHFCILTLPWHHITCILTHNTHGYVLFILCPYSVLYSQHEITHFTKYISNILMCFWCVKYTYSDWFQVTQNIHTSTGKTVQHKSSECTIPVIFDNKWQVGKTGMPLIWGMTEIQCDSHTCICSYHIQWVNSDVVFLKSYSSLVNHLLMMIWGKEGQRGLFANVYLLCVKCIYA